MHEFSSRKVKHYVVVKHYTHLKIGPRQSGHNQGNRQRIEYLKFLVSEISKKIVKYLIHFMILSSS